MTELQLRELLEEKWVCEDLGLFFGDRLIVLLKKKNLTLISLEYMLEIAAFAVILKVISSYLVICSFLFEWFY